MMTTKHLEKPSANIEVIPAGAEQAPIVANLLELYGYDFSEFLDLDLGSDGRFGYRDLQLYWQDPNRHPFLVRVAGKWAGLIMVKRGSELSGDETVWDMAEFFVVRRYRRRGIGTAIAHQVWRQSPGRWEVRVMQANHSAYLFWKRAITRFLGAAVPSVLCEAGGKSWHLFSFESKRVA